MNPNKKMSAGISRMLLDQYCWFLHVEMVTQKESAATLNQNGWIMQKSQNNKLNQSTIYDMNESLLH